MTARVHGPAATSSNQPSPSATLQDDTGFDSTLSGRLLSGSSPSLTRWMGWRLRLLVVAALLGCFGVFLLASEMAAPLRVDATWRPNAQGRIELAATGDARLGPQVGQTLRAISGAGRRVVLDDALALQHTPRWIIDDEDRRRYGELQRQLRVVLSQGPVQLEFSSGETVETRALRRGFGGLSVLFWLLSAFALVLYMIAMVVLLAKPSGRNLLYAAMALSQAGNLLFMAMESTVELALLAPFGAQDARLRMVFDLVSAAAVLNATCMHPRRLPGSGWIALFGWGAAALLVVLAQAGQLAHLWWWLQIVITIYCLVAIGLLSWSYQIEPHPFAMVLRRFGIVAVSTWVLLTIALAATGNLPGAQRNIASIGPTIWYVFFASLLLLVPFLSRSQQVMREFSLLAAISTVATSLDLLFVAVFSLGQFASLTLSLFISLGVYSGARQWILNQLLGSSMLTTERMFEQLYRIAREVEAHPERTPVLLSQLLRELFEPMEVIQVEKNTTQTRVAGDGSTMLVPVPLLARESGGRSIAIRFAHRGRRLFTSEDARLTDRIIEQLRRAVAFDKAVEQGRSEERLRLAQDLHDDIGARLLTLMYKAESPEVEDYVRHTLQDLKTLTRGLAAPNHRLSHAAAEWKSDLTQRLNAAQVELGWSFQFDNDLMLTVVQWSALTRVLRELVSNAIAHSQAERVDIEFHLQRDRLELTVSDNGVGRNPRAWSHGLGLGGVRKRVKQLGGEVEWRETSERGGITCHVIIRELSARP